MDEHLTTLARLEFFDQRNRNMYLSRKTTRRHGGDGHLQEVTTAERIRAYKFTLYRLVDEISAEIDDELDSRVLIIGAESIRQDSSLEVFDAIPGEYKISVKGHTSATEGEFEGIGGVLFERRVNICYRTGQLTMLLTSQRQAEAEHRYPNIDCFERGIN